MPAPSGRRGPFIPVNCPGISSSLFESQFYGHVRGAFTGASSDTLGVVRAAEGGTLLLDEIGELPLHLQPKLLRLLQQREVTPVGASRPIAVDVRFIAATNCQPRPPGRRGQVPPGPLPPPEHRPHRHPPAAAATGGRRAAAGLLPGVLRPALRDAPVPAQPAPEGLAAEVPLAGQRPRAVRVRRAAVRGQGRRRRCRRPSTGTTGASDPAGPERVTADEDARRHRAGQGPARVAEPRPGRGGYDPPGAGADPLQPLRRRQAPPDPPHHAPPQDPSAGPGPVGPAPWRIPPA